jgi:TonB family protein
MEFLSLLEPEPPAPRRLTRAEALILSVAVHVLGALLIVVVPRHLPPSVLSWLVSHPPPAIDETQRAVETARLKEPPIPLKFAYRRPLPQQAPPRRAETAPARPPARLPDQSPFGTFVKVPDRTPAEKNPNAPYLSDLDRRARQEVPTPTDARASINPHGEGNTEQLVRPDPTRPKSELEQDPASLDSAREATLARGGPSGDPDQAAGAAEPGGGPGDSGAGSDVGEGTGGASRSGSGAAGARTGMAGGGPIGAPGRLGAIDGLSAEAREGLRRALENSDGGERKETFFNPGYLRSATLGQLSFDTQDFPWGDYGHKVMKAIGNAWYPRIPLAAREGLRGYSCVRFTIEKSGAVTDITVVLPAQVPPFNRAATDALAAAVVPPLPEGYPNEREGVTACFLYNMMRGEIEGYR